MLPFTDFAHSGNTADQQLGGQLIREGRVGCLLLAGGQGTRLGFDGPKGCFPISVVHKKSLFQLCAETVLAASRQANHPLQLAIMTSEDNDQVVRSFFSQHHYFGLDSEQVNFFTQDSLPLLDKNGKEFLESPNKIARGPNGNGMCLQGLVKSGIWGKWKDKGIETVNVILIDNPLADPFDAELVGFHSRHQNECTLKCTEKRNPDEKVGVLVKEQGQCRVIEYTELPEDEKRALVDGRLKHCCANLSLFCFSMNFIKRVAAKSDQLPLHKAWKAAKYLDDDGATKQSAEPMAWKSETYIFDVLLFTDKVGALLYPREHCFAPLKNAQGEDSPETVRAALERRDRELYREITGSEPPQGPFELRL